MCERFISVHICLPSLPILPHTRLPTNWKDVGHSFCGVCDLSKMVNFGKSERGGRGWPKRVISFFSRAHVPPFFLGGALCLRSSSQFFLNSWRLPNLWHRPTPLCIPFLFGAHTTYVMGRERTFVDCCPYFC